MQWKRDAAYNVLQIRTSKMSGEFEKIWSIAVNGFLYKKIKAVV